MSSIYWQCDCGYVEHGEILPTDCPKCFDLNKFSKVPEDMNDQAQNETILSLKDPDE